jgi:aminoglycoside 6'-N-acetyltransferase
MPVPPAPELHGAAVVLRPVVPEDEAALIRIRETESVLRWWGPVEPGFPFDDDAVLRWTVHRRDASSRSGPVGMVQAGEEPDPDYRHAGIDLFLDPSVHGHGLGRDVVRTVATWLVRERGHHRLVIDPAADNAPAIACYRAVGFRPVGVMRRYERGPDGTFHDGMLMDLLAEDLGPAR